ncbi:MAG: hypothetical protein AAGA18_03740 [Verrucomicrobiota bacterium]
MIYFTLQPLRVAIDTSILNGTAKKILKGCSTLKGLQETLGYEDQTSMPEEIIKGFQPQKNNRDFVDIVLNNQKRSSMRAKRIAKGFPDFQNRLGIRGWVQKTFFDKSELSLNIEYEAIEWIHQSLRFNLLVSLHDMLIGTVASGEPREVDFSEISSYPNPISEMLTNHDRGRAQRITQALSSPLDKVSPEVLVDDFAGYVIYQRSRGFAYYYSENE